MGPNICRGNLGNGSLGNISMIKEMLDQAIVSELSPDVGHMLGGQVPSFGQ